MNVVTIITGLIYDMYNQYYSLTIYVILYIISIIYYELMGLFLYIVYVIYVFSYDEGILKYKTFTGCAMIAAIGGSTVGN